MEGEKHTPLPEHGLAAAAPVPPVDAPESEKRDKTGTEEQVPQQGAAGADAPVEPAGDGQDGQGEQKDDTPKPQQAGVATFFVCAASDSGGKSLISK